jgi:hypothetical protein
MFAIQESVVSYPALLFALRKCLLDSVHDAFVCVIKEFGVQLTETDTGGLSYIRPAVMTHCSQPSGIVEGREFR